MHLLQYQSPVGTTNRFGCRQCWWNHVSHPSHPIMSFCGCVSVCLHIVHGMCSGSIASWSGSFTSTCSHTYGKFETNVSSAPCFDSLKDCRSAIGSPCDSSDCHLLLGPRVLILAAIWRVWVPLCVGAFEYLPGTEIGLRRPASLICVHGILLRPLGSPFSSR